MVLKPHDGADDVLDCGCESVLTRRFGIGLDLRAREGACFQADAPTALATRRESLPPLVLDLDQGATPRRSGSARTSDRSG